MRYSYNHTPHKSGARSKEQRWVAIDPPHSSLVETSIRDQWKVAHEDAEEEFNHRRELVRLRRERERCEAEHAALEAKRQLEQMQQIKKLEPAPPVNEKTAARQFPHAVA